MLNTRMPMVTKLTLVNWERSKTALPYIKLTSNIDMLLEDFTRFATGVVR